MWIQKFFCISVLQPVFSEPGYGSGLGPDSIRSVDPYPDQDQDPGGYKWPTKMGKNLTILCFKVLDVLFWGLKASSVAWTFHFQPKMLDPDQCFQPSPLPGLCRHYTWIGVRVTALLEPLRDRLASDSPSVSSCVAALAPHTCNTGLDIHIMSWVRSKHPRHSGIWGAADEAVVNIVHKKIRKIQNNPPFIYYAHHTSKTSVVDPEPKDPYVLGLLDPDPDLLEVRIRDRVLLSSKTKHWFPTVLRLLYDFLSLKNE